MQRCLESLQNALEKYDMPESMFDMNTVFSNNYFFLLKNELK